MDPIPTGQQPDAAPSGAAQPPVPQSARLLLVGTVLALTDLPVAGFDLVPDVIGMAVVVLAVARLEEAVQGRDDLAGRMRGASRLARASLLLAAVLDAVRIRDAVAGTVELVGPLALLDGLQAVLQLTGAFLVARTLRRLHLDAGDHGVSERWRHVEPFLLSSGIGLGMLPLVRSLDDEAARGLLVLVVSVVTLALLLWALLGTARSTLRVVEDPLGAAARRRRAARN